MRERSEDWKSLLEDSPEDSLVCREIMEIGERLLTVNDRLPEGSPPVFTEGTALIRATAMYRVQQAFLGIEKRANDLYAALVDFAEMFQFVYGPAPEACDLTEKIKAARRTEGLEATIDKHHKTLMRELKHWDVTNLCVFPAAEC